MIYFIGVIITMLAFVGLEFFNFNNLLVAILGVIGFGLAVLSLVIPRKIKFKNRELVYQYELLPIAENIYAIKMSDGKIVYNYINENNESEIQATDSYWKEINEIETGEKACIKFYEKKPKFTFTTWPFVETREEIEINIPKGSIID